MIRFPNKRRPGLSEPAYEAMSDAARVAWHVSEADRLYGIWRDAFRRNARPKNDDLTLSNRHDSTARRIKWAAEMRP